MVLAVWTLEPWAAPPIYRDQHLLLDLVHWLLGHSVPEEEGRASEPLVSPLGLEMACPPHSRDFDSLAVGSPLWTWLL